MIVPISFGLKYEGITKREHGKIMRLLMRNMMLDHVTQTLPGHFENNAQTSPGRGGYGYKARSKNYEKRKQRLKGHNKPLVWDGKLRRKVLTTARATVRATQYKATTRPSGTRVKYKDKTRPLLSFIPFAKQEIEVISNREVKEYARYMEKQYVRLADRLKQKKTIRRASRGG